MAAIISPGMSRLTFVQAHGQKAIPKLTLLLYVAFMIKIAGYLL